MLEPLSALTLELRAWIARRPRTYAEAMEAWRSTCPRHSVWEDALIGGFIEVVDRGSSAVILTPLGKTVLEETPNISEGT
jgi:hypothetical protein